MKVGGSLPLDGGGIACEAWDDYSEPRCVAQFFGGRFGWLLATGSSASADPAHGGGTADAARNTARQNPESPAIARSIAMPSGNDAANRRSTSRSSPKSEPRYLRAPALGSTSLRSSRDTAAANSEDAALTVSRSRPRSEPSRNAFVNALTSASTSLRSPTVETPLRDEPSEGVPEEDADRTLLVAELVRADVGDSFICDGCPFH